MELGLLLDQYLGSMAVAPEKLDPFLLFDRSSEPVVVPLEMNGQDLLNWSLLLQRSWDPIEVHEIAGHDLLKYGSELLLNLVKLGLLLKRS